MLFGNDWKQQQDKKGSSSNCNAKIIQFVNRTGNWMDRSVHLEVTGASNLMKYSHVRTEDIEFNKTISKCFFLNGNI